MYHHPGLGDKEEDQGGQPLRVFERPQTARKLSIVTVTVLAMYPHTDADILRDI